MKELLDKISSYNIFNYLLPGIVFVALTGNLIAYPVGERDIIKSAFLYYFVGLVVSRFGSLIIEPCMKRLALLKFAPYEDFVAVSTKDEKLEVLSEMNNSFRTFCSLFTLLLLLKLYAWVEARVTYLKKWDMTILIVLLLALFVFSYRKQTSYITDRITMHR